MTIAVIPTQSRAMWASLPLGSRKNSPRTTVITRVNTAPPVLCTTLSVAFSDDASEEDITSTTAIEAIPESRPTTAATTTSAFSHTGLTNRIPTPVIANTVAIRARISARDLSTERRPNTRGATTTPSRLAAM